MKETSPGHHLGIAMEARANDFEEDDYETDEAAIPRWRLDIRALWFALKPFPPSWRLRVAMIALVLIVAVLALFGQDIAACAANN